MARKFYGIRNEIYQDAEKQLLAAYASKTSANNNIIANSSLSTCNIKQCGKTEVLLESFNTGTVYIVGCSTVTSVGDISLTHPILMNSLDYYGIPEDIVFFTENNFPIVYKTNSAVQDTYGPDSIPEEFIPEGQTTPVPDDYFCDNVLGVTDGNLVVISLDFIVAIDKDGNIFTDRNDPKAINHINSNTDPDKNFVWYEL